LETFGDKPVFLDITRLLYRMLRGMRPTGVDRVCLAYAQHFRERARAMVIWNGAALAFSAPASIALFHRLLHWELGTGEIRPSNHRRRLPHWPVGPVPSGSWVFNMGHSGLDQRGYHLWLRRKKIRLLVMVHDLIPITHPQFCRAGAAKLHQRRMGLILGHATGIVCNSQHTADVLRDYAQGVGLPVPPTTVIPLGVQEASEYVARTSNDTSDLPYFVMVGTLEPRKNHAFLLRLWRRMLEEWAIEDVPQLRIIGQVGWMCDTVVQQLRCDSFLQQRVQWIADCDDRELAEHLRDARALLFPSQAEGYGLPLLEALSRGVPVLANPLPAFRDIAGSVPEYLDLDDDAAWLEAIRAYASPSSTRRDAQLQRVRGFRTPTWPEHFTRLEEFLSYL
jgi:glycosyltransferase involved in cell wall biosynthesis